MISAKDPFFGALDGSEGVGVVGDGFTGGTLDADAAGFSLGRLARSEAVLRREEAEADLLAGLPFPAELRIDRSFGIEGFDGGRPFVGVEDRLEVRGWVEVLLAVPVYAGLPVLGVERLCPMISPCELRVILLAEPSA